MAPYVAPVHVYLNGSHLSQVPGAPSLALLPPRDYEVSAVRGVGLTLRTGPDSSWKSGEFVENLGPLTARLSWSVPDA